MGEPTVGEPTVVFKDRRHRANVTPGSTFAPLPNKRTEVAFRLRRNDVVVDRAAWRHTSPIVKSVQIVNGN